MKPNLTGRRAKAALAHEHTPVAIQKRLASDPSPSVVRDGILGATDGCVTTFAVVAGAMGGALSEGVVIILGFANLIADGFSMAASNYLGVKTQNEELEEARAEEIRHIEAIPEGEREEVRQIYAGKGFTGDLLDSVVTVITGNRNQWVETMIKDERGLQAGDAKPIRAASATFAAFCLAGMVPLLSFVIPGIPQAWRFPLSCLATAATFFGVGFLKGIILKRTPWRSAGLTLLLGGSAAGIAYFAGFLLSRLGME